jgi:hypothetical protein
MVPELSRSADHLCQQKINEEADEDGDYFKGNLLKTPDYTARGITPSVSMIASPGVSQWTVNESTTQTEGWHDRGDSFDSSKSYSLRSGNSMNQLNKHHRSRSVPSIRCAICKQNHYTMKPSESMHYATRTVTFQGKSYPKFVQNYSHDCFPLSEPSQKIRGSLPDLRHDCTCPRRYGGGRAALYHMHESSGSTESLLEEADEFVRHCDDVSSGDVPAKKSNRRCSEADIQRGMFTKTSIENDWLTPEYFYVDYHPSKQSLPFLPKSSKCLKPGQLAKVIAKSGRVVVGRIRYCGPVASIDSDETFVGLQLPNALGDCDGSLGGKKFFEW